MARIVTLLASAVLVVASGIVLQLSWETISEPKAARAQSREASCPGPSQVILSESGGDVSINAEGHANYGPFTTSTDSFVVTMDASSSQPGGAAFSVSQIGATPESPRHQRAGIPGSRHRIDADPKRSWRVCRFGRLRGIRLHRDRGRMRHFGWRICARQHSARCQQSPKQPARRSSREPSPGRISPEYWTGREPTRRGRPALGTASPHAERSLSRRVPRQA